MGQWPLCLFMLLRIWWRKNFRNPFHIWEAFQWPLLQLIWIGHRCRQLKKSVHVCLEIFFNYYFDLFCFVIMVDFLELAKNYYSCTHSLALLMQSLIRWLTTDQAIYGRYKEFKGGEKKYLCEQCKRPKIKEFGYERRGAKTICTRPVARKSRPQ